MELYIKSDITGMIERVSRHPIGDDVEYDANEDVLINPDKYKIENGNISVIIAETE